MIIVLFILISVAVLLELTDFKYKRQTFIGILVALVILEASKWESGIDFYNCYNHYRTVLVPKPFYQYEILYNSVVYLFAVLKAPYHLFLFFLFSVVYTLYYFTIIKISPNWLTTLLLLFCITIGLMGSNRQILALAIGFFATVYFLPEKKIYFVLLIICAGFFHQSAFFFLPLMLMGSKISYQWWLLLFVFAVFVQIFDFSRISFDYLILNLGPEFAVGRVKYYNGQDQGSFNHLGFTLGVIRRIIPVLLLIKFKDQLINRAQYYLIFNILCFSVFIYILLYHDLGYVISRIGVYYLIFEAVAYAWLIPQMKKSKHQYFYVTLLIFFAAFLLYKNTLSYQELFFPFKTIFGSF